ncbi:MAG: NAD(P)-binding domain-containing protein, partial [Gemmatimonadota bacterium]|nr:NAD(P)-binding domain-containing protein [Gemmatimonadota bacterium]
ARFGGTVQRIDADAVVIGTADGGEQALPADLVYVLIGFHPDFALLERIGIHCDPDSGRPTIDPETLETNVAGVYLAGSATAGRSISEIFIENGRFDGEKIFGSAADRARVDQQYTSIRRPRGE